MITPTSLLRSNESSPIRNLDSSSDILKVNDRRVEFAMSSMMKMTSKQYLMLGPDPPGIHLELAHGEIYMSPSPSPDHSDIILGLAGFLRPHIKQHKLGKLYADT